MLPKLAFKLTMKRFVLPANTESYFSFEKKMNKICCFLMTIQVQTNQKFANGVANVVQMLSRDVVKQIPTNDWSLK